MEKEYKTSLELGDLVAYFTQEADSCSEKWASGSVSAIQQINIEIRDAGGGAYIVIKTEEWAVDSVSELTRLVDRVVNAFKEMGGTY